MRIIPRIYAPNPLLNRYDGSETKLYFIAFSMVFGGERLCCQLRYLRSNPPGWNSVGTGAQYRGSAMSHNKCGDCSPCYCCKGSGVSG